ncbi:cyclic peptide export ABC transporter [Kovacikia minuta CCNUW1]|uniref:cyclic peptide export ABC transporter n=1 Tax=Kovacikia minuta TaxID=2931930 RepID=UPI001CCCEDA4|nr:cyclic peptide export ABC transporter [Kovacikia minuta]UBF23691.1 cyclic peptide export ABC transporter [Kovacikia minuta CCNUW1]
MNIIVFLLQSSWKTVAIAIATGFLSGISSAGLIALISRAVGQPFSTSAPIIIGGFAGLALTALFTSIISQVMLVRLSQAAVMELRMRLSRQVLASELRHLEQVGNPRLLATLTEDVQAVANAAFEIPFICIDLAIVFGCLVYIAWLSWSALLLVFALMGVAMLSSQQFLRKGGKLLGLAREEQDRLFKHFRALTEGIKELKLHYQRRQDFLNQDLEATVVRFRRYNVRGLTLFAMAGSWGKLLFFFAIGFVLFVLPNLLTLSPQAMAGYILTFTYLMTPMDDIVNNFPVITRANISFLKIESLGLTLADRAEALPPPAAITADWHRLELKGVTYPYGYEQDDRSFTLGPIDLAFQPGELVFIVGGNGSGKSTLAKLITGLYVPETGEILLDEQPITTQNREWYRQHFSVVFSDFYLFERLLGVESSQSGAIAQDYLKQLRLDHKVTIEADGRFSTTALSQGQRKRLALLTAYLEDRPIYLFDEWAADQDPIFKEFFYTELLPKLKNRDKTILVISHDDHYFHLGDRMIKLDQGKVEYDKT